MDFKLQTSMPSVTFQALSQSSNQKKDGSLVALLLFHGLVVMVINQTTQLSFSPSPILILSCQPNTTSLNPMTPLLSIPIAHVVQHLVVGMTFTYLVIQTKITTHALVFLTLTKIQLTKATPPSQVQRILQRVILKCTL